MTERSKPVAVPGQPDPAAPRYVLLGPPASGKGTQGRKLAEYAALAYLSTGALLRREVAADSPLGRQAKVFLDKGDYLPDELMESLLEGWLVEQTGGWVLDGFPRTLPQARWLDGRADLTAAIALEVARTELERRITGRLECQSCHWTTSIDAMGEERVCPKCAGQLASRADDDLRNFRSRHQRFEALTLPAIGHYLEQGRLVRVDGAGPAEDVFHSMIELLRPLSHGQAR